MATLTGKQFFPHLIAGPFHHGLVIVFSMAIIVLLIAAGAVPAARWPLRLRRGRPGSGRRGTGEDGGREGTGTVAGNTVAGNTGTVAGNTVAGNTVAGNTVAGNTVAEDPGRLADTALGVSPDLAIEVAAEVADEATRDSRR